MFCNPFIQLTFTCLVNFNCDLLLSVAVWLITVLCAWKVCQCMWSSEMGLLLACYFLHLLALWTFPRPAPRAVAAVCREDMRVLPLGVKSFPWSEMKHDRYRVSSKKTDPLPIF